MASPLTEAREAVAAALAAIGVTVYAAPPESASPPAVILRPGQPWHFALTYAKTGVNLNLTLLAQQSGSDAAALERLESLAWDVRQALEGLAVVGEAGDVRQITYGPAQFAAADIAITVHVSD